MVSVSRTWLRLSWLVSALMALAAAAGVFVPAVYVKESTSWAAQGRGQDAVTLLMACPALVMSASYATRGSTRAVLVWLGIMIYVVYSYVLYAFFVHFGAVFPIYVAVLGLSSYALAGAASEIRVAEWRQLWPREFRSRAVSAWLVFIALAFGGMWIVAITRAMISGTAPEGVAEIGLPVNPVHVLDLAFMLPLTLVTGVAHWKRRAFGLVAATPLLVFFVLMDAAIVSMTFYMRAAGVTTTLALVPAMIVGIVISGVLAIVMLRNARAPTPNAD
jgi:hypothetical protein